MLELQHRYKTSHLNFKWVILYQSSPVSHVSVFRQHTSVGFTAFITPALSVQVFYAVWIHLSPLMETNCKANKSSLPHWAGSYSWGTAARWLQERKDSLSPKWTRREEEAEQGEGWEVRSKVIKHVYHTCKALKSILLENLMLWNWKSPRGVLGRPENTRRHLRIVY